MECSPFFGSLNKTEPNPLLSGIVGGGGSSDGGSATGRNGAGDEAWGSVDALSTGMDLMSIGGAAVGWDATGYGGYGDQGQQG
jgi:hypothetical protein